MRSIRLSLAVYFMALLALALGAASLFIYRTAEQMLEAKKATTIELFRAQYRDRAQEKIDETDKQLLAQAETLAGLTTFSTFPTPFYSLGMLSAVHAPGAPFQMPLWMNEATISRLSWELMRRTVPLTNLNESELLGKVGGQVAEYFQIDTAWRGAYRSASLDGHPMPFNPEQFAADKVLFTEYDTIRLTNGITVRRVKIKMPATSLLPYGSFNSPRGSPPPGSDKGGGRRKPPRERSGALAARPPIYIQCACEISRRDEALRDLEIRAAEDVERLEADTNLALVRLRNRLLLMNALTFVTAACGCLWLVRLGLSPLQRLSEAVSQVTPRDFRLPLDSKLLPSELKPIEEKLTGTLDLLKRAFAREKQATADISHELRTPLAALLTTIELALRKSRTAEAYREMLQDCHLSAQHMNGIVERLLTLARLDAGVDRLRTQPVDVTELAEQCATVVRPLAEARGLQLNVHQADNAGHDQPSLLTDPDKLREVLNNLLHNAVQYNRPQGRIDLHVSRQNGSVVMEVRDTGIGIPSDKRDLIFERFFRADPSRTADGMNAGLGLAIVKKYVELMGGQIRVESEEGQGSTFRVRLPVDLPGVEAKRA